MKVDLKREIPTYTARRGRFDVVTVPPLWFLMVDGHGDPNTAPAYRDGLASLYPLAYALKFLSKSEFGRDYAVMPLEALWWADDLSTFTTARDKSRWDWTLMILTPDWITPDVVEDARAKVRAKGGAPVLDAIRRERFDEGLCVQTLHVGPYDDEAPLLDDLHHRFVPEQGLRLVGKHHEVYLGDPRRADSSRLRTILRQPVARS